MNLNILHDMTWLWTCKSTWYKHDMFIHRWHRFTCWWMNMVLSPTFRRYTWECTQKGAFQHGVFLSQVLGKRVFDEFSCSAAPWSPSTAPHPHHPPKNNGFHACFKSCFQIFGKLQMFQSCHSPLSVQPGDPKEYDLPGQSRQSLA